MWDWTGSEREMFLDGERALDIGKGTATGLAQGGDGPLKTTALAGAGVGLVCTWPRLFASIPEG
jgi:hypothetical protein